VQHRAPLLLIVDLQVGLQAAEYGQRNNASASANVALLLSRWRCLRWPVIFTRHISSREESPLAFDSLGREIESALEPQVHERVFDKRTNSAFKAPGFSDHVHQIGPSEVFVVGVATDACVTASAREGKDLGYQVAVVGDACATFERAGKDGMFGADLVHSVSLAALAASGIAVLDTAELLARFESDA
jgi:nicotinamidase-related amidase